MKDQLLTGLVVAQKWTTSDGNQSFEFAVLGQHFFVEWSFQFEFANKLSTNVSHYLISFHEVYSAL